MISAQEALGRLREGNRRFVAGTPRRGASVSPARRDELVVGQEPFAVVLGCSDSRVPTELIFDQGLGDLFVIRVAGNIVAPSLVGSVEYAVDALGAKLVVVLGHSSCGAVTATLEQLEQSAELRSPNLRSIVDRIQPSIEGLLEIGSPMGREALLDAAIRANVRTSVGQLRHGSQIIEHWIAHEGLRVVGAEYRLDTGVVDFFHDMDLLD